MFFTVAATNRFVSLTEAIGNGFSDVASYRAIADAFPHFPESVTMFHHAQRLFFPYIIGMISYVSGISIYLSFLSVTIVSLIATLYVTDRILSFYNVSTPLYCLCMALLIFNPYVFRSYLTSPGMITDLLFLFGTSVIILGLIRNNRFILAVGCITAVLARQTTVVFIPAFFLWLFISETFRSKHFNSKLIFISVLSFIIIFLYKLTGFFASFFGGENINYLQLFSLIVYLRTSLPDLHGAGIIYFFMNLISRDIISLIIPIAVLVPEMLLHRKDSELLKQLCLMVSLALLIMLQPVMNGNPESATRLVSFAAIPLVSAIALISDKAHSLKFMTYKHAGFMCLLCYIASFHHYYSIIRAVLPSFVNYQFAALYFSTAAVIFIVLRSTRQHIN